MKDDNYIKYLEVLALSLLDERADDRADILSTDKDEPSFNGGVTFAPYNARDLIAKQRAGRTPPPADPPVPTVKVETTWVVKRTSKIDVEPGQTPEEAMDADLRCTQDSAEEYLVGALELGAKTTVTARILTE